MLTVISRVDGSRGAMNAEATAIASISTVMPARMTNAMGGGPRNLSVNNPTTVAAPHAYVIGTVQRTMSGNRSSTMAAIQITSATSVAYLTTIIPSL